MNKAKASMGGTAVSRIQKGLDERSSWWDRILLAPWVWAALTIMVCAAILLPSAGGLLPDWAPGDLAVYDILLPMDITVPDPAATEAMRVEAREAVRPVYDFEPRQQIEIVNQINAIFLACRVVDTEGGVELQWSTVSDLNLEEEMLSIITGSDCSDEFEAALTEVVAQLYQHRIVDDRRALDRRAAKGLVLRNFATGTEREIGPADVAGVIDVRTELEDSVRAMLLEQAVVKRAWLKASVRFLTNNL
ncbi:MAG: hypothetical protein DRJ61_16760, partial [Acidobacteria bacterium]